MKKASLPEILILMKFEGELCSDEPIQILVIFSWFQMFRSKTKLEGFVWSHWSIKIPISHSQDANFWQVDIFHHVIFQKSHNFKNSNIGHVTLQYSINIINNNWPLLTYVCNFCDL